MNRPFLATCFKSAKSYRVLRTKFQPPRICYVVNHIYGSDLDVSYDASLSS